MLLNTIAFLVTICISQIGLIEGQSEDCKETETIRMNDGNMIPFPAYGTYLSDAIEAGFRHIDTAFVYGTEDLIGEAIRNVTRRGIVKRADLFITTKLSYKIGTRAQVIPAVKEGLKRLQLDYVDLYLIHSPSNVLNVRNHDFVEVWKGLEDAKRQGLTKSIGVSNFNATEINRLFLKTKTPPAVNQIEVNPSYTNLELVAYCQTKNIVVMAYAPFGFAPTRQANNLRLPPSFNDPILKKIAEKYDVEVSQIFLRYLVDRGVVPIPKSLNKEHIKLNIDILDFTLTSEEILIINDFDTNIKVFFITDEELVRRQVIIHRNLMRYAQQNNLQMYRNG